MQIDRPVDALEGHCDSGAPAPLGSSSDAGRSGVCDVGRGAMKDLAREGDLDATGTEALRRAAWRRIVRLTRVIAADLRDGLRASHDMTLPQFEVLTALRDAPEGLRMSALSDALLVSNGNVTGIVERLVEQGLVRRYPITSDRRATLVLLTERGAAVQDEVAARHDATLGSSLRGLDARGAAEIIALLDAARPGGLSSPR
jgi:DNA-binding MarR family transcriptional regulator